MLCDLFPLQYGSLCHQLQSVIQLVFPGVAVTQTAGENTVRHIRNIRDIGNIVKNISGTLLGSVSESATLPVVGVSIVRIDCETVPPLVLRLHLDRVGPQDPYGSPHVLVQEDIQVKKIGREQYRET